MRKYWACHWPSRWVLDEIPGLNEPTPYLHLFFEMGNGDFIAFFDEPEGGDSRAI